MNKFLEIAIIGGGIGGLTTAIALRKRGFSPVLYERASELKPLGAGIVLAIDRNAQMILEAKLQRSQYS